MRLDFRPLATAAGQIFFAACIARDLRLCGHFSMCFLCLDSQEGPRRHPGWPQNAPERTQDGPRTRHGRDRARHRRDFSLVLGRNMRTFFTETCGQKHKRISSLIAHIFTAQLHWRRWRKTFFRASTCGFRPYSWPFSGQGRLSRRSEGRQDGVKLAQEAFRICSRCGQDNGFGLLCWGSADETGLSRTRHGSWTVGTPSVAFRAAERHGGRSLQPVR
jgi:hypothetical protein